MKLWHGRKNIKSEQLKATSKNDSSEYLVSCFDLRGIQFFTPYVVVLSRYEEE